MAQINFGGTLENVVTRQEFTLEKAYEHRLKLMKERTAVKQSFSQHSLSLCEH